MSDTTDGQHVSNEVKVAGTGNDVAALMPGPLAAGFRVSQIDFVAPLSQGDASGAGCLMMGNSRRRPKLLICDGQYA